MIFAILKGAQSGYEKVIWSGFLKDTLHYDSPWVGSANGYLKFLNHRLCEMGLGVNFQKMSSKEESIWKSNYDG